MSNAIARNPAEMTLRDWQCFFRSIYGERNENRFSGEYGLSRMWLHLVQDVATLAKGIRRNDIALVLRMLPRLFCWLCGFCTKLDITLDDIAWHFFPSVCPTCWNVTCGCGASKRLARNAGQKDEHLLNELGTANLGYRPKTLDDFVAMFANIYGNHSESANLTDVYLHFSEEVGEVAAWIKVLETENSTRPLALRELASELADVFSWMCKLCWRVNHNLRGFAPWAEHQFPGRIDRLQFEVRFSAVTALEYACGCPGCGQLVCISDCQGWERQKSRLTHA